MAILITILMVGVMLSIAFALTAIFLPKIRVASDTKNSVTALYAAESSLEWCLYKNKVSPSPVPALIMWTTGVSSISSECTATKAKAIGTYKGVTRAFELTF